MFESLNRMLAGMALATALAVPGAAAAQGNTKIHWYGHAAFRIETPTGAVILIDPWLTAPTNPDKESLAKLDKADYILLTHGHGDHVGQTVEIGKKTGAVLVAPYGLQFNMKSVLGYPEKQATLETGGNVGGTMDLPKAKARVTFVHAVHGSEFTTPFLPAPAPGQPSTISTGNPVGYVLEIEGGPTIYHTGDTEVYEDMKMIGERFKVDVMLVCIGGHFTMAPAAAAMATQKVGPRKVVPMHWGSFGLLKGTPDQFKAEIDRRGVKAEVVFMKPGETRAF